jgi:hypothetical protein
MRFFACINKHVLQLRFHLCESCFYSLSFEIGTLEKLCYFLTKFVEYLLDVMIFYMSLLAIERAIYHIRSMR